MNPNQYLIVFLLIYLVYPTMGKERHTNMTTNTWSNATPIVPTGRFFSSRLDYNNKWLPVGRGDPLKNDPTYDYSPPLTGNPSAIDHRIRYWDEKTSKSTPHKSEILLLGVSSRKSHNHNFDRRYSDIPTVMLPPPIQSTHVHNYKIEKNSNNQFLFGIHKMRYQKPSDSQLSESNIYTNIVNPSAVPTPNYQSDLIADEINKLSNPSDYHMPMYTNSVPSKKFWLQDLLQKEVAKPSIYPNIQTESVPIFKLKNSIDSVTEIAPPFFLPTIHPTMTSNFKAMEFTEQPMNPTHLIIQGHSRVKTYGQGKERKDPKIIEVKSVEDPVVNRVVSKDEHGIQFDVKHLHIKNKSDHNTMESKNVSSSMGGLLSLLDLSFGEFLDNPSNVVNETDFNEIKIL